MNTTSKEFFYNGLKHKAVIYKDNPFRQYIIYHRKTKLCILTAKTIDEAIDDFIDGEEAFKRQVEFSRSY